MSRYNSWNNFIREIRYYISIFLLNLALLS